jgi:hypothetical protein
MHGDHLTTLNIVLAQLNPFDDDPLLDAHQGTP